MKIRILLSTALILIIGLIYFRFARPEAMVIESLVSRFDTTETIDTRSRDLLLEKLDQGDRFTQYYVARSKRSLSKLGLDAYRSLLNSGQPEIDAMLSPDFLSGTSVVDIEWGKALSLYLSGLDSCSIHLGNVFDEIDMRGRFVTSQSWGDLGPPVITGIELIELAKLSESQHQKIHEQLSYCSAFSVWAARDLALFEWKILGDNRKFLVYLDQEKAKVKTGLEVFKADAGEEYVSGSSAIAEAIKPEFGTKSYMFNLIPRGGLEDLETIRDVDNGSNRNEEAVAARLVLGMKSTVDERPLTFTVSRIEEIPEGDFSAEEQFRTDMSSLADSNGLAATYLHRLSEPEDGIKLSDEEYAQSSLRMVQSDYDWGACNAGSEIELLFPNFEYYSDDGDIQGALVLLCINGHLNQLDLLEQRATNDFSQVERDHDFSIETITSGTVPNMKGLSSRIGIGLSAILIGFVFFYLAYLCFIADPTNRRNKSVCFLLISEGLVLIFGLGVLAVPTQLEFVPLAIGMSLTIPVILSGLTVSQGYFIASTETSLGAFFARFRIGIVIASLWLLSHILSVISSGEYFATADIVRQFYFWSINGVAVVSEILIFLFMHSCILICLITEHRKRDPNKESSTSYFLYAYFMRFVFFLVSLLYAPVMIALAVFFDNSSIIDNYGPDVMFMSYIYGELIYGLLFCYGIVKGNIFGITQLIKRGIVKVLFTASLFTAFYFMEGIVSNEFSDALGSLAGFLGASLLLMFEKPINRYAYNFIDYLIPDNESLGTSEEAYLYLYRVAIEDGTISQDEQRMLDSMAQKLELGAEDVQRIKNTVNRTT